MKLILRFLKGTSRVYMYFLSDKLVLDGFTDADMAGDVDLRKFTSEYFITFVEGAISWQLSCRIVLLCQLQMSNILQLQKLANKSC